jgi:hypothetical protein
MDGSKMQKAGIGIGLEVNWYWAGGMAQASLVQSPDLKPHTSK